ncbi:hypothetical protein A0H81_09742 [Grifola frondosa]|uniref:Uncharacterized protein n=1 Tax=Grifola frondosa TaxID=5627 RepID=A0A1C7M111_GRIFR|nr:hypothetical protein A0H81_09742 [Grifola frondosa]
MAFSGHDAIESCVPPRLSYGAYVTKFLHKLVHGRLFVHISANFHEPDSQEVSANLILCSPCIAVCFRAPDAHP